MGNTIPMLQGAFKSAKDGSNGMGKRPVIFDIIAPDGETSLLPDSLKMVLHVNPNSMKMSYQKVITRMQMIGGYVEQHWGDGVHEITFEMATGGFMRLFSGLSNVTGGGFSTGGTRRETIAYDKYLDLLALFHNNGAIYDTNGNVAFQGQIKIIFDGGIYFGWFNNFSVSEEVSQPYQFKLSTGFTVEREIQNFKTTRSQPVETTPQRPSTVTQAQNPIQGKGTDVPIGPNGIPNPYAKDAQVSTLGPLPDFVR